jgi:hypothetical protein
MGSGFYLTLENIAVNVNKLVMLIPIRASTIFAGRRKLSHVIKISRTLGKYVCTT